MLESMPSPDRFTTLQRTLRLFACVSRFLPCLVQIVMFVYALTLHSWMFALMSLASAAMGLGYAVGDLVHDTVFRSRHTTATTEKNDGAPPRTSGEEAIREYLHTTAVSSQSDVSSPDFADLVPTLSPTVSHTARTETTSCDWRDIVHLWHHPVNSDTFTCSLALNPLTSQPLNVNLIRQGPHALVAGTTGSGKSVLLQGWCLNMALHNPPDQLKFIFLDFKGGATFRTLEALPHCWGSVSDLSVRHARRALRAIEQELQRREQMVAQAGVSDITHLDHPPARIVIVVDEFNALKNRLPDYMTHLMRIASQGRSLAMNLILATQSPLGQVSTEMRANINLTICLRLRDRLQSSDLVDSPLASEIPHDCPGLAILNDGDGPRLLQCPHIDHLDQYVTACERASHFLRDSVHELPPRTFRLFSLGADAPTFQSVQHLDPHTHPDALHPLIGWKDDGIHVHPCLLDVASGNIAIAGSHGRGKTHALAVIRSQLGSHVQCIDDADSLLDPLNTSAESTRLRTRLHARSCRTVICVHDPASARYPELCSTLLVFPTGDRTTDLMAGIPARIMEDWEPSDYQIPGRAVLLSSHGSWTVQIVT